MSDEHNKRTLLVEQDEALGFYLDSLLSPQENEAPAEDGISVNSDSQEKVSNSASVNNDRKKVNHGVSLQPHSIDKLQSAKDFLQASKKRQQLKHEQQTKPLLKKEKTVPVKKTKQSGAKSSQTILSEKTRSAALIVPKQSKTITRGPVSPKPREPETSGKNKTSPAIVFSQTGKDGQVIEQVLIPRSQKVSGLKQTDVPHTIAKSVSRPDTEASQTEEKALLREKPSLKETQSTKEAPKLDLSLFLPKIKTLSEAEIAQQIEALTQAAVSHAQLESDLAHAAQLELDKQSKKIQVESDADGLKRNIENAPSWAVPDFQVLLFAVAGLKLAVPLNELNGIVEWGNEYITELPGHASWYLGLIQNQGKNVPVIDTLQQVVPANRWPADHLVRPKFKHIILIDNGRWGLACETVLEVLTLKTDSVKWRSSRTRRRWLLGTVIEHMCALLDSTEFAAMLKTGDDSLVN